MNKLKSMLELGGDGKLDPSWKEQLEYWVMKNEAEFHPVEWLWWKRILELVSVGERFESMDMKKETHGEH